MNEPNAHDYLRYDVKELLAGLHEKLDRMNDRVNEERDRVRVRLTDLEAWQKTVDPSIKDWPGFQRRVDAHFLQPSHDQGIIRIIESEKEIIALKQEMMIRRRLEDFVATQEAVVRTQKNWIIGLAGGAAVSVIVAVLRLFVHV